MNNIVKPNFKKAVALLSFVLVTSSQAEAQKLTLDDITNYNYYPNAIYDVNPMSDGPP